MMGIGTFFTALRATWSLYKEGLTIESLKKELQVAEANLSAAKEDHRALEKEIAQQEENIAQLQAELAGWNAFEPVEGVLFRRFPNGTIEVATYCPKCKLPMFEPPAVWDGAQWRKCYLKCSICGHVSMVTVPRAKELMAALRTRIDSLESGGRS
jgi:hypothetical protein